MDSSSLVDMHDYYVDYVDLLQMNRTPKKKSRYKLGNNNNSNIQ